MWEFASLIVAALRLLCMTRNDATFLGSVFERSTHDKR